MRRFIRCLFVYCLWACLLSSTARATIEDHPTEFAALSAADQKQARLIEEHLQQKGLDGLTNDQVRFAFEGKGAPLLRSAVIDAAENWDGGSIAPLHRMLGLRPQLKVEYYLRYKPAEIMSIMSYAQKIFDMRHEIPEGMNPIIKKYPPLKLAIRMRAAGQRPVDPTVLEEWAAKQAAVAKSQDEKRRATEALTKLKDDLKKIQAKITASDKAKPKSAASGKNRAVVRKQLEEQVTELTRKIAEAEKEQSGAEEEESDE